MSFTRGFYQQALRLTFDGPSIENFGERATQYKRNIVQFMVMPGQLIIWLMRGFGENKPGNLHSFQAGAKSDGAKLLIHTCQSSYGVWRPFHNRLRRLSEWQKSSIQVTGE